MYEIRGEGEGGLGCVGRMRRPSLRSKSAKFALAGNTAAGSLLPTVSLQCEWVTWVTYYPADGITVYRLRLNEFGIHFKQFKDMSQAVFARYSGSPRQFSRLRCRDHWSLVGPYLFWRYSRGFPPDALLMQWPLLFESQFDMIVP